jgi:hypothetical protein
MLVKGFTDKDMGYDRIMTNLRVNAGDTTAFVGFLRSSGKHKGSDVTVAQVAAINEYGNEHTPERSFIRSALSEHTQDLKKLQKKIVNQIVSGKLSKKKGIGIIAQHVVDWIKNKIDQNIPPPNAKSTIAAKGSSHTLIDTGQMRNSVEFEISSGKK